MTTTEIIETVGIGERVGFSVDGFWCSVTLGADGRYRYTFANWAEDAGLRTAKGMACCLETLARIQNYRA